jgi:LysM repeat protein
MARPSRMGLMLTAVMLCAPALAVGSAHAASAPLQPRLSIASPSSGALVGGLVQVAVAFDAGRFGKVTALELWVNDHFYAAMQIDLANSRGTFNLDLDTLQLANGQHSLKVRALAGSKVIATDQAVVTVTNGGVDIVPPLVSFRSPLDGDTISGIATIDLNVSDNDRISIVSLFANKLPLMLRSSPPYTYSLDTTTLPLQDGKATLTLEAMAYDRAQNVGKAKSITVTVKNPINATPMQPDPVPGPSKPTAAESPAKAALAVSKPTTAVSKPATGLVPSGPKTASEPRLPAPSPSSSARVAIRPRDVMPPASRPVRTTPTVAPAEPREDASIVLPLGPPIRVAGTPAPETRLSVPSGTRPAKVKTPVAPAPARRMAKVTVPELRAVPRRTHSVAPVAPSQPTATPASGRIPLPVFVVKPVTDMAVQTRTYQVAKGDRLSQIARQYGVTPQSILVANGLADASKMRAGSRLVIPGTFNVAMNNQQVGFDVQPRMEQGLPIAPFRQIFEHTGGTVVYYPEDHSVKARKPEKEIQLKIGSKEALVNQAVVIMDRKAFIDSGRTMLPMRFMTEALDMKAEYDPKTGTVYLTRKEPKLASASK